MAELMFPNLAAAIQQGVQFGTQQRQLREGEQRRNQLADLASRAYAAPSQERQGLIQQAVAVDPESGLALGSKLESREVDQSKRAGNVADYLLRAFESKNPAQIQGAYQAVKPYFQQMSPGTAIPEQVDESILPMLHQLKAAAAGSAGDMPAGFAEFEAKAKAAGLVPGSPEYQEAANIALGRIGRAASGGFGFTEVIGPDGRKRIQRNNPRTGLVEVYNEVTGGFDPVGGAAALNPQQFQSPQMAPGEVPFAIDPSLPPEVQAAIRANPQQFANATEDQPINIPGMVRQSPQVVGRSPEEQAALTTQAEERERLNAYRNATGAYAEREGAMTVARETAERQAESSAALPQVIAAADETVNLLDRVLNHPGRESATGTSSLNPLNRIPGTSAYDFNVLLDQIKGQAFLQAFQSLRGGGAITEREGQAATNAIARLNAAQSEQEFVSAINDLKRIVSQGRTRAIEKASRSGTQPAAQPTSGWSIQRVE